MMQDNGVARILTGLPSNSNTMFESKDENEISLSTRNTIPWKLECELNEGYSRDFGYE